MICGLFSFVGMESSFVEHGRTNYYIISGMTSFFASVIISNIKIIIMSN